MSSFLFKFGSYGSVNWKLWRSLAARKSSMTLQSAANFCNDGSMPILAASRSAESTYPVYLSWLKARSAASGGYAVLMSSMCMRKNVSIGIPPRFIRYR